MIRGWTNVDLRRKLKGDLEWKLKELNKKSGKLNEEEKALQEKIIFVLNNPESDSESNVNDSPDVVYSESVSESSNSVEGSLDTLGNIVIVLGVFSGLMLIFYAMLESIFFFAIWGLVGILSALISGYVLKGLSRIISLLSSLQNTNSKEQ
jgi:hypothetical protein